MAQVKCNLLKPVDNLTGNIFLFSQYAQDLTKQYSNPDSYRCVPSKYIALNLDFEHLSGENQTQEEFDRLLGNVFQNYFENACTFLRSKYKQSEYNNYWNPEYTRTLLFQTLEKYQLIKTTNLRNSSEDTGERTDGTTSEGFGAISGVTDNIQHIGDINVYSYNDNEDGVGYSEIYCYIPNEAKCMDYQLLSVARETAYEYPIPSVINPNLRNSPVVQQIMGYNLESDPYLLYNGLNSLIWKDGENGEQGLAPYFVDRINGKSCYGVGVLDTDNYVLVPACLSNQLDSDDHERKINVGTEEEPVYKAIDKFDVNAIVLLYDIVSKGTNGDIVLARNIPLGIYFTGQRVLGSDESSTTEMTNKIIKYVDSGQIYNQGTSYGLRICTRFLNEPNSTTVKDTGMNAQIKTLDVPIPDYEDLDRYGYRDSATGEKIVIYREMEDGVYKYYRYAEPNPIEVTETEFNTAKLKSTRAIIQVYAKGSSNVSELAPVLEKMGETLMSVEDILDDKDKLYQMLKDHLAQFKDNKVNVPYVRQLGNKKYWFVNGKNTGAIAQYEYVDPSEIIAMAIREAMKIFYTKDEIDEILKLYLSKEEFNAIIQDYATRTYVDQEIEKLRRELLVRFQGPLEPDEYLDTMAEEA